MKPKPITAGCMAMVIGTKEFGLFVNVKSFLADSDRHGAVWVIDHMVEWQRHDQNQRRFKRPWMPEKNLLRIDDPDIQQEIEAEKEAVS